MIDLDSERARLQHEIEKIQKDMSPILEKLSNQEFLRNAPEKVVKLNQSQAG